jgi:hypothetical protein
VVTCRRCPCPEKHANEVPRYGIAEWYGRDTTTLTPEERQAFGQLALNQCETGDLSGAPVCRFLSTLSPGALCNKTRRVSARIRFTRLGCLAAEIELLRVRGISLVAMNGIIATSDSFSLGDISRSVEFEPFKILDGLINSGCERRALRPLRHLLGAYPEVLAHTDLQFELLEALKK